MPLRAGERFVTLAMPAAYTPKPPRAGTDDYRCFLLDPKVTRDSVVTGVDVVPGSADVVHHVILLGCRGAVALAEQKDRESAGQGWTCFGGSGVENQGASLDAAPWLGAWAPEASVLARDLGMPLEQGSRSSCRSTTTCWREPRRHDRGPPQGRQDRTRPARS